MMRNLKKSEWLLIFARAPQMGRVKTRLARDIGTQNALQIYIAMLRDTTEFARELSVRRSNCQIALAFTPSNAFAIDGVANLGHFWNGERVAQNEGDLGEKMRAASTWAFERGAERVLLIGTDSPDLPPATFESALAHLQSDECEMTVSPARDGGFVLLGLKQPIPPQLFDNIDWTQNQTLSPLLRNAEKLGWRVAILPDWFDVDEMDDLALLRQRLQESHRAPHCAQWLRENPHLQVLADANQ